MALAAVLLTGCEVARVPGSLTTRHAGSDPDAQMDFLHELAEKNLASNDEALHALTLFVDSKDDATDYAGRVANLKSRGLIPKHFDAPSDEAVQRGVVAYFLCKVLDIKGGISMHLFGVQERYAVRELMDKGLFPTSSPNQTFSGTELVGIIGKAEDFQRGGAGDKTPGTIANEPR